MVWFSHSHGSGSLECDEESSVSSQWWTGSRLKTNSSSLSETDEFPTLSRESSQKIKQSHSPIVISYGDDSSSDSESIESKPSSESEPDDGSEVRSPSSSPRGQLALIRSFEESDPVGISSRSLGANGSLLSADGSNLQDRYDADEVSTISTHASKGPQRFNDENVLPAKSQDSTSLQVFYDTATVWKGALSESGQNEEFRYWDEEDSIARTEPEFVEPPSCRIIGPPSTRTRKEQLTASEEEREPATTQRFPNDDMLPSRDDNHAKILYDTAIVCKNSSYESQQGEEVEADVDLLSKMNSGMSQSSSSLGENQDFSSDESDHEGDLDAYDTVNEKRIPRHGGKRASNLVRGVGKAISRRLSRRRKVASLDQILSEMEEDISSNMSSKGEDMHTDTTSVDTDKNANIHVNVSAVSSGGGFEMNLQSSRDGTTRIQLASSCARVSDATLKAESAVELTSPPEKGNELRSRQDSEPGSGVELPPYMKRRSKSSVDSGVSDEDLSQASSVPCRLDEERQVTESEVQIESAISHQGLDEERQGNVNDPRMESCLSNISSVRLALAACCSLHYLMAGGDKETTDVDMSTPSTPSQVSLPPDVEAACSPASNDGECMDVPSCESKEPKMEQNEIESDAIREDSTSSTISYHDAISHDPNSDDQFGQKIDENKSRSFGYNVGRAVSRRLRREALKAKIKGLQSLGEEKTRSSSKDHRTSFDGDAAGVNESAKDTVSPPCLANEQDLDFSTQDIVSPPCLKAVSSADDLSNNVDAVDTGKIEPVEMHGEIQSVQRYEETDRAKNGSQSVCTSSVYIIPPIDIALNAEKASNSSSLDKSDMEGRKATLPTPPESFDESGNNVHTVRVHQEGTSQHDQEPLNAGTEVSREDGPSIKATDLTMSTERSDCASYGERVSLTTEGTGEAVESNRDTPVGLGPEAQFSPPNDNAYSDEKSNGARCVREQKEEESEKGPSQPVSPLPVTMATSFDSNPWWDLEGRVDSTDSTDWLIPCKPEAPSCLQDEFDSLELLPLVSSETVDSEIDLGLSISVSSVSEYSVDETDSVSVADSAVSEFVDGNVIATRDLESPTNVIYDESVEMTASEDPVVDEERCKRASDSEPTLSDGSASIQQHDDPAAVLDDQDNSDPSLSNDDELCNAVGNMETQTATGIATSTTGQKRVRVFSKKVSHAVSTSIQRRASRMKARRADRRNEKILAEAGMTREEDLPSIAETNESSCSATSSKVSKDETERSKSTVNATNKAILVNNTSLIEVDDAKNGEIEFYII